MDDKAHTCEGMDLAIQGGAVSRTWNLTRRLYYYGVNTEKKPRQDRNFIIFNLCPWCGETLVANSDDVAEGQ